MTEISGVPAPLNTTPFDMTRSEGPPTALSPDGEQALRDAARELEAAFLSEMLKQARFGEARGAFGGGVGEDQFASFLRDEHARAIAERGGIGLAQSIFNSLLVRANGGGT